MCAENRWTYTTARQSIPIQAAFNCLVILCSRIMKQGRMRKSMSRPTVMPQRAYPTLAYSESGMHLPCLEKSSHSQA